MRPAYGARVLRGLRAIAAHIIDGAVDPDHWPWTHMLAADAHAVVDAAAWINRFCDWADATAAARKGAV